MGYSDAGIGGTRGATGPPPIFGRSVNPILTGEGRLSPPITTGTPNVFHLLASLRSRVLKREDKRPTVALYGYGFPSIKNWWPFCFEQLHSQIICTSKCSDFQKKFIDAITTSNFYLEFKENNENDMTFCYFSCLGRYCFRPTSLAALSLSALARWCGST